MFIPLSGKMCASLKLKNPILCVHLHISEGNVVLFTSLHLFYSYSYILQIQL